MVVVAVPVVPVAVVAVQWGNAELFPLLSCKAYILRIQTHHIWWCFRGMIADQLDHRGLAQGLALS